MNATRIHWNHPPNTLYRRHARHESDVSMSKHTICTLETTITSRSPTSPDSQMSVTLWYLDGKLTHGAVGREIPGFGIQFQHGGSWYLSTLLAVKEEWTRRKFGELSDSIAIDCGQSWTAHGMRAVLEEALALILSGKVRIP